MAEAVPSLCSALVKFSELLSAYERSESRVSTFHTSLSVTRGIAIALMYVKPTWTGYVSHDDVLEESREVELDVARLDLRLDDLLRRPQRQHHGLVDFPPLQRKRRVELQIEDRLRDPASWRVHAT